MIELDHVSWNIGRRQVLDGVSLTVGTGKIVGIIGENGSGKTSLLKIMAGLLTPKNGTAKLGGEPITRKAADRIAYMADTDLFFPYFTPDELFRFYESQFADFNMEKALEIADDLSISPDAKLKDLSKGSRARAKIAATLGREADYYLLDEPFSGLDPMVRKSIAKGLIRFTDPERQTVIMTTHEIQEVEPLLDQVIVLKSGRIIAEETVDSIRDAHGMDTTNWMMSLFEYS